MFKVQGVCVCVLCVCVRTPAIHKASQVLSVLPDKEGPCLLCVFSVCGGGGCVCVCVVEQNYVRCVHSACLLSLPLYLALGTHSEANHLLMWDVAFHFKPN